MATADKNQEHSPRDGTNLLQPIVLPEQQEQSDLKKLSEHYIVLSRDAAKQLTTVGFTWAIALVVVWLVINNEIGDRIREISTQNNKIRSAQGVLENMKDNNDNDRISLDRKLATETSLRDAKKERTDIVNKPVTFPLPGLPPFAASPRAAPALWTFTSMLVLAYLSRKRSWSHG